MKIFIAIPTFESIYPDTFKSIYGLDHGGHQLVFDFKRGYDCARARNMIVEQTFAENADYLLMVDSDIVLPSDAIVNFLDDPKDVCIGVYANRGANNSYEGSVCAYKTGEFDYVTKYTASEIDELYNSGKYKVQIHGGGMGCALIHVDVLKKLSHPWYKYVTYPNKSILSEDLYFCDQCRKHHVPVYMDTRVKCGHIFRYIQWPISLL